MIREKDVSRDHFDSNNYFHFYIYKIFLLEGNIKLFKKINF